MPIKVTGNEIEIDHLPAQSRMTCFDEVNLGYSAAEAILEAQRCLQCPIPSCQEGCPNTNPIRDFIDLIAEGKFEQAAELGWTQNALLSCTGRVCAWEDQCEGFCVLSKRGDPINIGALERFMGDFVLGIPIKESVSLNGSSFNQSTPLPTLLGNNADSVNTHSLNGSFKIRTKTANHVAVIGAGPAGLTVAHFLGRQGYPVTVFDRHVLPGGVMSYGIPEFVLPQRVMDKEVRRLESLGVEFRFGVNIGQDLTIDNLFEQGYGAVFIGIGANKPLELNIQGHDLNGLWSAKEFLMKASLSSVSRDKSVSMLSNLVDATGISPTAIPVDPPPSVGSRVAVIGAGNTAMDAARTALRLGAEWVSVLYRRSEKESPSRPIEIGFAKEEGVHFHYLVNPTRFIDDGRGNLAGIELVTMRLEELDASGRPCPVPIPGSEYIMPIDTCIAAIGYQHEDLIPSQSELSVDSWGGLIIDNQTGATNRPGVFAGGDCVTGSKTVVHAVAAGRRAAASIQRYLNELGGRNDVTCE